MRRFSTWSDTQPSARPVLIAALGAFFLSSQAKAQAQAPPSPVLRQINELVAETKALRSEVSKLSELLKQAIEDRDIILSGVGKHGEIIKLPPGRGNTNEYFFFVSVPNAGIPSDSFYPDNGFSGFGGSATPLPDGTGWQVSVISADNGGVGGMASVTARFDKYVHYLVVRRR